MRRGMDPPEDPPGGSLCGDEIYLPPETRGMEMMPGPGSSGNVMAAPVSVVTTNRLMAEPSMISLDADLCYGGADYPSPMGGGGPVQVGLEPSIVVPPDEQEPSLIQVEPPTNLHQMNIGMNIGMNMDPSYADTDDMDAPVMYQEPPASLGPSGTEHSRGSFYSETTTGTSQEPTFIPASSVPPTSSNTESSRARPGMGMGMSSMRDPSMISISEDVPIHYDMPPPMVHHQQHQQQQPVEPATQAETPAAPRPKFVRENEVSVDSFGMLAQHEQQARITASRARPKVVPQNEVSVDGFAMMQGLQHEISVDSFIRINEPAWKRDAPKPEVITNEVNADSVIGTGGPMQLEKWRTHAASESKGISVIGDASIGSEINVDSVIRIERERPPPPKQQSSNHNLHSIVEEPPARPKPFGPPSTLDDEINVDSVIRINQEQRQREQQAKIAAMHQRQEQEQRKHQAAAQQQWQQKVALQQKAAQEYREASITSQQQAELDKISPVWDVDASNHSNASNSSGGGRRRGSASGGKKKKGFLGKLFKGKGRQ